VTEGRVAEIVAKSYGFCGDFVDPEGARNCRGDLGDLQAVGQAPPVTVLDVVREYLCLVLKSLECAGPDDPVTVAMVFGSVFEGASVLLPEVLTQLIPAIPRLQGVRLKFLDFRLLEPSRELQSPIRWHCSGPRGLVLLSGERNLGPL